MLRLVCPLALLVVGACQCGSEDLTVLSPHVVGPSSIELGVLYAGFSRSAWIAVDNTGEAPAALRATTVTQTAGPPVELGVSPSLGELAAGERLLLEVHALASDGSVGPFTAEVQLAFDDEELRVAVLGEVRSIPECADDPCAEVVFDGTRCVATPLEDGTSCEDHDACTVRTVCAAGRCVGQLRTCPDDGIACTVETCSPDLGCSSVPVDDRCDDGNACTDDTCGSGGCVHLAEPDGTPCSEDVCALALCQDQACVELDIPLEELCAPGEECLVDPSCFEPAGPWASVAGGERHTCAITDDHALYCWGTNEYAERWFSPVPVQEPTLATDWRQVAAGSDVTCAIKLDGRLFCWGDNHMMQFGQPTPTSSAVPVEEETASGDWSQVSLARDRACAVKTDGRLFCWGAGTPMAELEGAGGNWREVDVGLYHSCGVRTDGALLCWGPNLSGETGAPAGTASPLPVEEPTLSRDWATVACGFTATCAVKVDGRLFCWGSNASGMLGIGSLDPASTSTPTQEATGAADWVDVDASKWAIPRVCARKTDGRLLCWGDGRNGGLATGTDAPDLTTPQPAVEASIATASGVTALSMGGGEHHCVLTALGRLFCWGAAQDLAVGGAFGVPVEEHAHATDWERIVMGISHWCGIREGEVWCRGQGVFGNVEPSTIVHPEQLLNASWLDVAAGMSTTCAVQNDHHLSCWGHASGEYEGSWTDVSRSGFHTCARDLEQRVFCWGWNQSGQVGVPSPEQVAAPVEVSVGATWREVSAGSWHTCGVREEGGLWCWGSNSAGQIGDGVGVGASSHSPLPVSPDVEWSSVSAGVLHSCGLSTEGGPGGALYCWGDNTAGQLGDGSLRSSAQPVREASGAHDWAQVSAGDGVTCALKVDGRVFCWGDGSRGALGTGLFTHVAVPVQEATLATDWAEVSTSSQATCARKLDGRLFCWGQNGFGLYYQDTIPVWVAVDLPALGPAPSVVELADLSTGASEVRGFGRLLISGQGFAFPPEENEVLLTVRGSVGASSGALVVDPTSPVDPASGDGALVVSVPGPVVGVAIGDSGPAQVTVRPRGRAAAVVATTAQNTVVAPPDLTAVESLLGTPLTEVPINGMFILRGTDLGHSGGVDRVTLNGVEAPTFADPADPTRRWVVAAPAGLVAAPAGPSDPTLPVEIRYRRPGAEDAVESIALTPPLAALPEVAAVDPPLALEGAEVTLSGHGFSADTHVFIGGRPALVVDVEEATLIVEVPDLGQPAGATVPTLVVVEVPGVGATAWLEPLRVATW